MSLHLSKCHIVGNHILQYNRYTSYNDAKSLDFVIRHVVVSNCDIMINCAYNVC